ncbi:MAG: glycosyltransferase [Methylococcales bacterium]|nr:glycosyltransferase [Methylococcales bacterium]
MEFKFLADQSNQALSIPDLPEISLDKFAKAITAKAAEFESEYNLRMLIVDDGSTDKTVEELTRYYAEDKRPRWIGFMRHFGKESAIHASIMPMLMRLLSWTVICSIRRN